jgi:hypothetical protein
MAIETGIFSMDRRLKSIGIDKPGGMGFYAEKETEENRRDQQQPYFHRTIRPYDPFTHFGIEESDPFKVKLHIYFMPSYPAESSERRQYAKAFTYIPVAIKIARKKVCFHRENIDDFGKGGSKEFSGQSLHIGL